MRRETKVNLVLVMDNFPAKGGDGIFIKREWEELCESFEKIILISRSQKQEVSVALPENVSLFWYKNILNKPYLFIPMLLDKEFYLEIHRAWKNCSMKSKLRRMIPIIGTWYLAKEFEKFFQTIEPELSGETILYTYWLSGITLSFLKLRKKKKNYRVISRTHGADLYNERVGSGYHPFREVFSKELDALYFVSEAGMNYFFSHWKNSTKHIRKVMYLGTAERKRISIEKGSKVVLASCSNMIPLKRIELIIEALAIIPSEIEIEWHHIGDGILRKELEEKADRKLGKRNNIRWNFWGHQPNHKIEQIYHEKGVNLFITTSSTEGGAPVSIQEAFSMGIPVVGTNVGGIPELVNKNTGYLLDENPSVEEIRDKICKYAGLEANLKMKLSDNAYQMWNELFWADKNSKLFVQEVKSLFQE